MNESATEKMCQITHFASICIYLLLDTFKTPVVAVRSKRASLSGLELYLLTSRANGADDVDILSMICSIFAISEGTIHSLSLKQSWKMVKKLLCRQNKKSGFVTKRDSIKRRNRKAKVGKIASGQIEWGKHTCNPSNLSWVWRFSSNAASPNSNRRIHESWAALGPYFFFRGLK